MLSQWIRDPPEFNTYAKWIKLEQSFDKVSHCMSFLLLIPKSSFLKVQLYIKSLRFVIYVIRMNKESKAQ